jgi:hypothetical protein
MRFPLTRSEEMTTLSDLVSGKYRDDYNNNPPTSVSFMTTVVSMSGSLHCELVRLLFLQDHLDTDRFFVTSGVQFAQHDRGLFHFLRTVFSTHLKSRVG